MKIGMVHWYYLPHPGGTEYLIKAISDELTECDVEVEILTGPSPGNYEESNPQINVERSKYLSMARRDEFNEKEIVDYLNDWIQSKDIDLLHAHNFQLPYSPKHTGAVHSAGVLNNIPVVLHVHNALPRDSDEERVLLESYEWDAVVPVSKFVARRIYDRTDLEGEKIVYIPDVVDTDRFYPYGGHQRDIKDSLGLDEEERMVICPTRILTNEGDLIKGKGVKTFIHALSHLSEDLKNFKGLITGAENEYYPKKSRQAKETLRDFARALDADDKLVIPDGTLPDDKLPRVYSASEVVALPSTGEAFGLAYIEGMASGLPAVGCLSGAVPEIITDGKSGYMVKPHSPAELTEALRKLLNNKELRERMGRQARDTVKANYQSSSVVERYLTLYHSLLD